MEGDGRWKKIREERIRNKKDYKASRKHSLGGKKGKGCKNSY